MVARHTRHHGGEVTRPLHGAADERVFEVVFEFKPCAGAGDGRREKKGKSQKGGEKRCLHRVDWNTKRLGGWSPSGKLRRWACFASPQLAKVALDEIHF
jgi:hypothetical protein